MTAFSGRAGSGSLSLHHDIFGECFESHSIELHDGDGDMTGLPGFDIADDAGFAGMCAADDLASGTVFEFAGWFGFHFDCSMAF